MQALEIEPTLKVDAKADLTPSVVERSNESSLAGSQLHELSKLNGLTQYREILERARELSGRSREEYTELLSGL